MENALSFITRFEDRLYSAMDFHLSKYPAAQSDLRHRWAVLKRIDLNAFLTYAVSRLAVDDAERVTFWFIDFKLQVVTLILFDWDYYNEHVLGLTPRDAQNAAPGQESYQRFLLYSYHHAEASKVRVVVERLMNVIYFLETREQFEGVESKKKAFEKFLVEHPDWNFMKPVLALAQELDDRFRTPELHKGSVIRKQIFGEGEDRWALDEITTKFIEILNAVMPGLDHLFKRSDR